MHELACDSARAEAYAHQAADTDGGTALFAIAKIREDQGHLENLDYLFRQAADLGSAKAMLALAKRSRAIGDYTIASNLYQQAIGAGLTGSLLTGARDALADLCEAAGDHRQAAELRKLASTGPRLFVRRSLADVQRRAGTKAAAEKEQLDALAAGESAMALDFLAEMREEAGDQNGAELYAIQAAQQGHLNALSNIAIMRANSGDMTEAWRIAHLAANTGETWPLMQLAKGQNDNSPLRSISRYGIEPDGTPSLAWW